VKLNHTFHKFLKFFSQKAINCFFGSKKQKRKRKKKKGYMAYTVEHPKVPNTCFKGGDITPKAPRGGRRG
jgi:hypothetical protein